MEYYKNQPKYHVAVDCAIFGYEDDELKLLLYPRGFEPVKGSWSLMGGFVQENESADESAKRVLKNTTGLDDIYLEQLKIFSSPNREVFTRVLSVGYCSLIRIDQYDPILVREHGAHWWPVTKLPSLIFDHAEMIEIAQQYLRDQADQMLIGSELLPDMFTVLQLRQLYEAIFQKSLDPGNFRKKVISMGILEKLKQKNETDSRKGAFYYQFKSPEEIHYRNRIIK